MFVSVCVQVWSLSEGRCLRTLAGHGGAVTTLTFDEQRIISGSLDCTIRLWSIDSGAPLAVLDWMKNEGHTGEKLIPYETIQRCD